MNEIIDNIKAGIGSGLEAAKNKTNSDIICPFCGEDNFDLIGLKLHLLNRCGVFSETPDNFE